MSVEILTNHDTSGKVISLSNTLKNILQSSWNEKYFIKLYHIWLELYEEDYNLIVYISCYILPKLYLSTVNNRDKVLIHYDQNNFYKNERFKPYKRENKILPFDPICMHKIFYLCQNYLYLCSDNEFLTNLNNELLKKLYKLQYEKNVSCHYQSVKTCQSCFDLKQNFKKLSDKHNDILKRYSSCQIEKEKIVVRYARSEKQILESKSIELLSKKQLNDLEKSHNLLQIKYDKLQDYAAKLSKDYDEINLEKTYLQNQLRYQQNDFNKNNKKFISKDTQYEEESIILPMENVLTNSEHFSLNDKYILEKENLQYKTNSSTSEGKITSLLERIQLLEQELSQSSSEKEELQTDVDAYRLREVQLQEFVQKLTDKNVQFQCDLAQLQSDLELHKACSSLQENKDMINNINIIQENLVLEKIKHQEECATLAHYIAEQSICNKLLSKTIENLKGENNVILKKYVITFRMMTRELHYYHTICKNLIEKASRLNINLRPDQSTGKWLEGEQLFNRIMELNLLNKKHTEKLEFLEEHSQILIKELQKKN